MKSFKVYLSALTLLATAANALPDWEGTYELQNGARITRRPQRIELRMGGLNMTMGEYRFSSGSSLNNLCATANGSLSVALTQEQFKAEVEKLGSPIQNLTITQLQDE